MGYYRNKLTIAACSGYAFGSPVLYGLSHPAPDVEAFRQSLPEEYRPLLLGPIRTPINGEVLFVLLPDGSQEGFSVSAEMDEIRERFVALFEAAYSDGSSPFDVITAAIRFGGDEPGAGYEEPVTVEVHKNRHVSRPEQDDEP